AFSRMGRTEMRCMLIDMKQLVQQVQKERELDLKDRNIIWEIGDLPPIYGDGGLLKLVVHNLMGNAIKYTRPREEAKIIIDYENNAEEIIYFIQDNGVGFDMRYVDKLFGVFQRLHSNTQFEGTGIGLANVRRIIQRHGGKTWAEGIIDQGATFYFALPKTVKNQEKCINDENFIS
ncbi:MAG TPA: ATP-binding protein, partial [Allocoleopsis sp.]